MQPSYFLTFYKETLLNKSSMFSEDLLPCIISLV